MYSHGIDLFLYNIIYGKNVGQSRKLEYAKSTVRIMFHKLTSLHKTFDACKNKMKVSSS